MKTQSENIQRWNDIIFENRNKAYGAYVIRKSYDDNVLTGWTISLGVATLVFLCSFFSIEKEILPPISVTDSGCGLIPPPIVNPNTKSAPTPPEPKQVNKNFPPVAAVTNVPDQKPVEPTVLENSGGTGSTENPGAGNSLPGSDIGTVAIPEPPKPEFILNPEVKPEYEGGLEAMMTYIQRKLRYPAVARRKGDEGTVYVSFIISSTGAVTRVEVIKGVSKECDQEAVRVISMMDKWSPGMQNKMPVAVNLVLPIKFKLDS